MNHFSEIFVDMLDFSIIKINQETVWDGGYMHTKPGAEYLEDVEVSMLTENQEK